MRREFCVCRINSGCQVEMATHLVNAAVTMLPFSIASASQLYFSQSQVGFHGQTNPSARLFQKTALTKCTFEEEIFFSILNLRQNHGACFRTHAMRSEYVDALEAHEPILSPETVNISTMLERSASGGSGSTLKDTVDLTQDVASSSQQFGSWPYVENLFLETGPPSTDIKESYSPNNVALNVPFGGVTPLPESESSSIEVTQMHDMRNLISSSDTLLKGTDTFLTNVPVSSFCDSPISIAVQSASPLRQQSEAGGLQSSIEAGSSATSSSIASGHYVTSATTEKGMEILSDSQLPNNSLPSIESTMNSISDTVSNKYKFNSEPFPQAKDTANFSVESIQKNIEGFLLAVQESMDSSVNSASSAAKNTYNDINESILKYARSVMGSFENAVSGLFPAADNTEGLAYDSAIDFMGPFQMGTPANSAIKKFVVALEESVGSAFATAVSLVIEVYSSTKALLSPEVQTTLDASEKKVSEIVKPLGSAIQQVSAAIVNIEKALGVDLENPIIPVILVGGGSIFVGLAYWKIKYGGYSGDLSPKQASDLLRKEGNAVLIDIRPQEFKESDGIPDLRRGERFKFACVELPKVEKSTRKLLKNANEIDDVLIAVVIKNLKIVNDGTKIIVMDANGTQSKNVARLLRKLGIKRSYRIQGGFQSWLVDGLRFKQMKTETTLTILKEETEAILEEFKTTPRVIFTSFVGLIAAIYVLIEWEKILQLIGVIGLGQVIYKRLNSYESAEDLKADVRALVGPFWSATQGILWVAKRVEPNKLQLATSPSTTAVQNRVIQAAAKHGSLPSELEQTQDADLINDSSIESMNLDIIPQEET